MQHEQASGINFFQRYLTVWVLLCMIVGVAIGHFLPSVPAFLSTLQVDSISIPIAILIWLMIYPMMMKVDFQSVKAVGRAPKGLFVTWHRAVRRDEPRSSRDDRRRADGSPRYADARAHCQYEQAAFPQLNTAKNKPSVWMVYFL